jgi:hypothetical protein
VGQDQWLTVSVAVRLHAEPRAVGALKRLDAPFAEVARFILPASLEQQDEQAAEDAEGRQDGARGEDRRPGQDAHEPADKQVQTTTEDRECQDADQPEQG